jgi:hypothetical protein
VICAIESIDKRRTEGGGDTLFIGVTLFPPFSYPGEKEQKKKEQKTKEKRQ